jgi:hypothetical protein
MNKHFLSLGGAAAVVFLGASSGSGTGSPPVKQATHFVGYFQQDPDSDVQTDPDSDGDYDLFYDRLATDGHWFNDDDYGYVWQPSVAVTTASWRPYADGHWVWTDRGWFWQSNENFGWATYHYGRWNHLDGVGWVWVPGHEWAPSWVSWRHTDNDDYVGWAPLPAESTFNVSVGVHPWADAYYDIGPIAYAFIRIGDFARPSYREYCVPPQESLGFYNRTINITNITYNNNVINSYGPQYERVSQLVHQQGGQPLASYKINYAAQTQANAAFKTSVQGNQLNVIAPPPRLRPSATVKPQVARELGRAQVDRGWQNVPEAQAKELRQQSAQQTPVPQNLPPKPVLPAKPQIQAVTKGEQHPPNEPPKGQQPPAGQLKPFIEKPENEAVGEPPKAEPGPAKAVQQEKLKPGEPPNKTPVVAEERKAAPAAIPTEKPKPTEVRTAQGEQAQPKPEIRHPAETANPAGHEGAPQHKKEETKKEPPPQARASQENPQRQPEAQPPAPKPEVAEAHAAQPHTAQPPPSEPHPAEAAHPKPNPQGHKAPANDDEKKKEEHKE